MISLEKPMEDNPQYEEFRRLMAEYQALNGLQQQLQVRLSAGQEFRGIKDDVDVLREEIEDIDAQIDIVGHTRHIMSNMVNSSVVRVLLNDLSKTNQVPENVKVDVEEINRLSQEVLNLTQEIEEKIETIREVKSEVTRVTQERDKLIEGIRALGTGLADAESEHSDELHRAVQSLRRIKGDYNFIRFLLQAILLAGGADLVGDPNWGASLVECGEDLNDDD